MSLIFSAIAILFCLLSIIAYLIISKFRAYYKLKRILFNISFYCLSSIPVICMAFDVIFLIEGMVGMFCILIIWITI